MSVSKCPQMDVNFMQTNGMLARRIRWTPKSDGNKPNWKIEKMAGAVAERPATKQLQSNMNTSI